MSEGKIRGCAVCKKMIDADRLLGSPNTYLCKEHGAAIEKFGPEYIPIGEQENLAKAGSLKHNLGGVKVGFKRNEEALKKLLDEYELERYHKGK